MATLKCALRRKNASGTYDVLALQGASDITYRPSGRTVEQDLNAYLPAVQSSDTVPNTLAKGKILTGNNKAWFGNSANKATELMTRADIQFKFLGYNPITKTADDTIAKWIALGTGYAFFTVSGYLNNQPSQYGFLINFVDSANVFQIWNTQGGGPLYSRSGNNSGWNTNFHRIDASDALKLAGGTMTGQIAFNASTADEFYPFKISLPSYNAFPLKFIKGDSYGVGLAIQSGGTIIVGGGEAAVGLFSRFKEENANYNPSTEDAYLAADQTVWICTNCQNPANRKTFKFDNAGNFTVPVNVTAAKFIGALQGNANTASTATKLSTARSIRTNLASGSAVNFDGSANITPGITGILPVANGGTGNNSGNAASATKLQTARNIQVNLASTSAASFNGTANIAPGVTGTLPVNRGGTGVTSIAALNSALGSFGIDVCNFVYKGTYAGDSGIWPKVFGSNRYMCWYRDVPGFPRVIILWNNNSYQVMWAIGAGDTSAQQMGATNNSRIKAEDKRVYFAYNAGSSYLTNISAMLITFYIK